MPQLQKRVCPKLSESSAKRKTENIKVLKRVDFETILKLHEGSQPRQGITVKWDFKNRKPFSKITHQRGGKSYKSEATRLFQ